MFHPIFPSRKIGQDQPRASSELESLMLHAKFQDHRTGSGKAIFQRFLPYMGMAAILVM